MGVAAQLHGWKMGGVLPQLPGSSIVMALLSSPQPDDPQDAVVARQYINERPVFDRTA
ncbi:ubiquitin-conjugating enzyme E2 27, partial [Haematococcus lacustris]